MTFEITGHKPGLEVVCSRPGAYCGRCASLRPRMAEQGLTGITIVNPKGEFYDIDRFGMIVSATEDGLHADQT